MGAPLRKLRIVANDFQRPLAPSLVPLAAPPRVVPFVRLPPAPPPRRNVSWAAVFAVFLLTGMIFMLGVVAGTVFWFTYDAKDAPEVVSAPPVPLAPQETVKLVEAPFIPSPPVQPPEDIVLPAENPPLLSPPAVDAASVHVILREEGSEDMDELLETAHARLEEGRNDAALALYERVLAQEPENHVALEGRIYTLQRVGRYDVAAEASRRLLKRDPQDAAAQAALAKALAQRGAIAEAVFHLDRAARAEPGNILYRLDLAILYDRAGQEAQALTLYRQVLDAAADGVASLSSAPLAAIRQRALYLEAVGAGE